MGQPNSVTHLIFILTWKHFTELFISWYLWQIFVFELEIVWLRQLPTSNVTHVFLFFSDQILFLGEVSFQLSLDFVVIYNKLVPVFTCLSDVILI